MTFKSTSTDLDLLPIVTTIRIAPPLKTSFISTSSRLPDLSRSPAIQKRSSRKRIQFSLKLEPIAESSLPSSREISASTILHKHKKISDPWARDERLQDAYSEYFGKRDIFLSNRNNVYRTPPPVPPPPPEPGAQPPTYTHTFVIHSQTADLTVDSITLSTPVPHLPRIMEQTKRSTKHQEQSTSPANEKDHGKMRNSTLRKQQQSVLRAALQRAESVLPRTVGLHPHNRITRPNPSLEIKSSQENVPTKKVDDVKKKPVKGSTVNNPMNSMSQSNLSNHLRKPQIHNRPHTNDNLKRDTPYFCQNHASDNVIQPVIHGHR